MNKKFFSAALFGGLLTLSSGAFVSCKDYDDDINAINKEIVDIKAAISELQAKVGQGKFVTNVVKGIIFCHYKTGFWTLGEPIAVQKEGK